MCGIAGIFHSDFSKLVNQVQVERMLRVISHRGPDESGIYLNGGVGIGNVRLSVIDLVSGSQPLEVQNNRYWIVYNGELFNYPEIRDQLKKKGYSFETTSDTEVVAQAYAAWGPNCLSKFNGQFAICIWDNQRRELFLARDRSGIRPLFYTEHGGSLYFCSEIKGLFQNSEIEKQFSPKGLSQIFQYWTTLQPETPYKNIFELPPGHYMLYRQNEKKIKCWWKLNFPERRNLSEPNFHETVEVFRELFNDAVKIRLRADVEVAAYLSGGIDSTVTTSFIHDIEPGILNTFSIGFSEKDFDESKYQLEASKYFNTNHKAYTCTLDEIGESFNKAVYYGEYPILRTAPVPMYLLSKKVREQNIKVVITGEGADEILAGYNIFKEAKIKRFWANFPNSSARPALLTKLYPYLPMMKDAKSSALKMFFGYALQKTDDPFYSHLLRWHNTSRIKNYFSNEMKEVTRNFDFRNDLERAVDADMSKYGDLAKSQLIEFKIFMSNYLLSSQGDRMAMGNSVEGRYPFLDHRVIEFASRLPERFKLNGLNEKFILKKMMAGRIPDSIMNRSKQAYRAPVSSALLGKGAAEYINDLLSDRSVDEAGYFSSKHVNGLIAKLNNGKLVSEIDHMALAGIVSTQLLHQFFIKGEYPADLIQDLRNLKIIDETKVSS